MFAGKSFATAEELTAATKQIVESLGKTVVKGGDEHWDFLFALIQHHPKAKQGAAIVGLRYGDWLTPGAKALIAVREDNTEDAISHKRCAKKFFASFSSYSQCGVVIEVLRLPETTTFSSVKELLPACTRVKVLQSGCSCRALVEFGNATDAQQAIEKLGSDSDVTCSMFAGANPWAKRKAPASQEAGKQKKKIKKCALVGAMDASEAAKNARAARFATSSAAPPIPVPKKRMAWSGGKMVSNKEEALSCFLSRSTATDDTEPTAGGENEQAKTRRLIEPDILDVALRGLAGSVQTQPKAAVDLS
jgi:hypothetical protein